MSSGQMITRDNSRLVKSYLNYGCQLQAARWEEADAGAIERQALPLASTSSMISGG